MTDRGQKQSAHDEGTPERYGIIPAGLWGDPRVSDGAKVTYARLRYSCDHGTTVGAWPSKRTLSEDRGVAVRTIEAHLHDLREAGWVEWTSKGSPSGTNLYAVHNTPREVSGSTPKDSSGSPPREVSGSTPRDSSGNREPIDRKPRDQDIPGGSPAPVREMHEVFVDILGGDPPHPQPTEKRRELYRLMWTERLHGANKDPLQLWRKVCEAVRDSDYHKKKRDRQMPEFFLREEERRDTWVQEATHHRGPHFTRKLTGGGP